MTLLRRVPALLLVVILALAVGAGPAPLLAAPTIAPAAQEAEAAIAGYYQSDVIAGEEGAPDLVVGLILYEDGTAEVLSNYSNEEEPIIEVGTWADNGDGTLTLTVTGTTEGDYAAPIELDFEIAEDGSLVVPGAENGAFGEEGLILVPTELGNDVLAQIPEGAIVYQSDVMPAASSPGLQLTLALTADGSLTLISDYMNPGEVVYEVGSWSEAEDGSLVVTLTGQSEDGGATVTDFDEPLEFVFTVNDDGSLSLVDEGGALFGEAGLTLLPLDATATFDTLTGAEEETPEEAATPEATEEGAAEETTTEEAAEEEAAADTEAGAETGDETTDTTVITGTAVMTPSGAYVSDLLPAEDGSSTFLVVIFYDDGSMLINTYNLNGALPVTEVGTWAVSDDGSYVLTATGTPDEEYAEPVELEFTIDEDGVISLSGIPLYPLEDIDLAAAPTILAEFQSDVITYTTDLTHTITLTLYDDDDLSAMVTTEYVEDGEIYTEYGTWDVSEADQLVVTLTGDDQGDYEEPVEWIFDVSEEGVLTLANDDEAYYGDTGLTLTPLVIEEELMQEGAGGDEGATGEEAAAEEVAPAEEATSEEATGEEVADEGAAAPEGIQVFQSDVLPAASSPGLQLTLGLLDDGSAAMDYDYQNDEEVVTNLGQWVDNGDGTITLTFTEGPTGAFDVPIEMTLELGDDGNLTIIDASEESLGLLDVVLAPIALE